MIMSTMTYSPEEVLVLVGVVPVLTFNEVKVSYRRPRWTFYEGTRGEFSRSRSMKVFGTISITIPRTSQFNDMLTAEYWSFGLVSVMIKDLQGLSLHFMLAGTMVDLPDPTYGKDVTDNVWNIQGLINLNVVGGSVDYIGAITGNKLKR